MLSIKIYLIIGPTGKIYVGQTKLSLRERLVFHKYGKEYLGRAIRKYGIESFKIVELDKCENRKEADNKERFYIKKLHSTKPDGYNLTTGGGGGDTFSLLSDEEKHHRSEIFRSKVSGPNNHFYGKHHSAETKAKLSAKFKGRKMFFSEEHRKKLSEAMKRRPPRTGWKHTKETKQKMAFHMYGEKNPMKRPEVRAKMSANHADFTGSKNPNYGKKHSLETRKKISEANKKRGNKYASRLAINSG